MNYKREHMDAAAEEIIDWIPVLWSVCFEKQTEFVLVRDGLIFCTESWNKLRNSTSW
jgi:hypothetical protein